MTVQFTTSVPYPNQATPSSISARVDQFVSAIRGTISAADNFQSSGYNLGLATSQWASLSSYSVGDHRWSPVDYKTYRCIASHSGSAVDPSSDTTNWVSATGLAPSDSQKLAWIQVTSPLDLTNFTIQHEFTASGAITAGDIVALKSANTVGVISGDADDWVGPAMETVADGEPVLVTMLGGVNGNQSGLTPATKYYIDASGSLTTTAGTRYLGIAISSTEILILGDPS